MSDPTFVYRDRHGLAAKQSGASINDAIEDEDDLRVESSLCFLFNY